MFTPLARKARDDSNISALGGARRSTEHIQCWVEKQQPDLGSELPTWATLVLCFHFYPYLHTFANTWAFED